MASAFLAKALRRLMSAAGRRVGWWTEARPNFFGVAPREARRRSSCLQPQADEIVSQKFGQPATVEPHSMNPISQIVISARTPTGFSEPCRDSFHVEPGVHAVEGDAQVAFAHGSVNALFESGLEAAIQKFGSTALVME